MDPKYPCPCGAGDLIIKTTKKQGVNHRKYLTCPAELGNCGFYSFLDELRLCKCRKGYCRNIFRKNVKCWCCPFKGTDASCGYFSEVVLPCTSSKPQPRTPCQPTPTTPRSASTPTTPRSTEEKRREALLRSLEASRVVNNALIDIIEDLANLPLNDGSSISDAL